MERERQQQQLYALVKEMNEALDRKRWRRLPGLHQQVMRVFYDYAAWETDATALREVKDTLHAAFEVLIARRTQRAEELKARMDQHQQNQEGMLAYSMVNLISEKA
ncbi:flagellar protein FliT [Citrobacter braakii]|uniref:flagellar protein FliT n=1 Tax=Citrobacter braakii TaxID=57706 RepID=UPI001908D22A|nr:flagellar protein FliT [Citrobacter braakii]MBJ9569022.1 flagellar protein FliT [Citrobacter braakii]WFV17241.1 flagellar protein FliT [Citrobacter braakii]